MFSKQHQKREIVFENKGINSSNVTIIPDDSYPKWLVVDKKNFNIKKREIVHLSLNLNEVDPEKNYTTSLKIICPDVPFFEPHIIETTLEKAPDPFISPGEITYDKVPFGREKKGVLEISNHGGGSLKIQSITFEGKGNWLKFDDIDFKDSGIPEGYPFKIGYTITTKNLKSGDFTGKIIVQFENIEEKYEIPVYLKIIVGPRLFIVGSKEFSRKEKDIQLIRETNIPKGRKIVRDIYIKNEGDDQLRIYRIESRSPQLIISEQDEIKLSPGQDDRKLTLKINTENCIAGSNSYSMIFYSNDTLKKELEFVYKLVVFDDLEEMDEYIGIDFGTTNSCVAYISEEDNTVKPKLIKFDDKELMPSILFFEGHDNNLENILIGEKARRTIRINPECSVRSVKRVLGTKSNRTFFGETYTPTKLATIIIKKVVEHTEDELIRKNIIKRPKKAILTVPASFFDTQIRAILEASTDAGLNKAEIQNEENSIIIDEPSAAAIYYIYKKYVELQNTPESEIILVYDFGGGTLDVSVIEIQIEGRQIGIIVRSTKGNNQLGGDDIDRMIMHYLADLQLVRGTSPTSFDFSIKTSINRCKLQRLILHFQEDK